MSALIVILAGITIIHLMSLAEQDLVDRLSNGHRAVMYASAVILILVLALIFTIQL